MVAHPGPRPAPFDFPYGAASRLREAAEALHDELAALERSLDTALDHAVVGFEGRTRQEAEAGFVAELAQCGELRARVAEQVHALEDARAQAVRAEQQREGEIADWHRALRRWEEHGG